MQIAIKTLKEPELTIDFVGSRMWVRDTNGTVGKYCPHKNCSLSGCSDCGMALEGEDDG